MTPTVNPLLLGVWAALAAGVWAADGGSLTGQQCRKASRAACAWVTHFGGHHGKAHMGKPCKEVGAMCVYHTTCHVNRVTRDIYICKKNKKFAVGPDKQINAGQRKHTHQHFPRNAHTHKSAPTNVHISAQVFKKPDPKGSSVHHRGRRSVDDAKAHAARQAPSRAAKMPYLFRRIIQRHRTFNVNAFNGGTYFLNGYSYVNNELQPDPVTPRPQSTTESSN